MAANTSLDATASVESSCETPRMIQSAAIRPTSENAVSPVRFANGATSTRRVLRRGAPSTANGEPCADDKSKRGDAQQQPSAHRRPTSRGRGSRRSGNTHRIERLQQLARRLRPVGGALLETSHHQRGQRGRHGRPRLLKRDRGLRHVRGQHLLRGPTGERRAASQHLVRRRAERVDVGAMVDVGIGARLLGRHVRGRSQRDAGRGERRSAVCRFRHRLRHAEVGHRRRVAGEENVVGLDVAVDDALRVGVVERLGDVAQNRHRLGDRQLAAHEPRPQRLAFDERHREVRQTVHLARGQQRDDVRMLEPRGDQDLAPEAVEVDAVAEFGGENLDDDLARRATHLRRRRRATCRRRSARVRACRRRRGWTGGCRGGPSAG